MRENNNFLFSSQRKSDRELSEDEPNRRKRYREFVEEMLRSKEGMMGEMDRRTIYGGEEFAGKLKKMYEMEEIIKPIGRPKKSKNEN